MKLIIINKDVVVNNIFNQLGPEYPFDRILGTQKGRKNHKYRRGKRFKIHSLQKTRFNMVQSTMAILDMSIFNHQDHLCIRIIINLWCDMPNLGVLRKRGL